MASTNKECFAIIGEFRDQEGRRRFCPDSPAYYNDRCAKQPLSKKYTATFSTKIPTRSQSQLAYHFVLCEYISEHTGFTVSETHELLMREKWGTKLIKIGKYSQSVRESVADIAKFPLAKMMEQINFDLSVCADLEIRVPSKRELGYVDEDEKIEPITNYPEYIGTPTF
jgi:hypothetical protein